MRLLRGFLILALAVGVISGLVGLPTSSAQEEVTISWWHITTNPPDRAYWDELAAEYMDANPNVNIEITVLENEAFKSQLVTVMQRASRGTCSRAGAVACCGSTRMRAWSATSRQSLRQRTASGKNSLPPRRVDLFGQDGEYYGVPVDLGRGGMFYNRLSLSRPDWIP